MPPFCGSFLVSGWLLNSQGFIFGPLRILSLFLGERSEQGFARIRDESFLSDIVKIPFVDFLIVFVSGANRKGV